MDANAQYELYLIKGELQSIIDELNNISSGVKRDFSGIGNEKCSASVSASAQHYRDVKAQLEKMDLSALSDEFIAKKQEEERKAATQVKTQSPNSVASKTTAQSSSTVNSSKSTTSKTTISNTSTKNNNKTTSISPVSIIKEALSWLFK